MLKITTKKGDDGTTELLFGVKVAKSSPEIAALGAVDELNAALGLVRVLLAEADDLARVQELLIVLMGELAMPEGREAAYEKAGFSRVGQKDIDWLEARGRDLSEGQRASSWLRPGAEGAELSARFHVARTVARRAEREVWALGEGRVPREVRIFLNRLSDWLWLCAREG
ncbi:MAG: cob(I)yrinic acid a,c-diamide adenosyltransferase [Verrucomicrobiales bacterium]